MNKERYFAELERKIRALFLMLRDGHQVPAEEKKYAEGFMHAALELEIASREELEALMERINREVFGMSIVQRRAHYRDKPLATDSALDTPTWERRGIRIDLGEA